MDIKSNDMRYDVGIEIGWNFERVPKIGKILIRGKFLSWIERFVRIINSKN